VKLVKEEPIGGAIGDGWRRVPGGHWRRERAHWGGWRSGGQGGSGFLLDAKGGGGSTVRLGKVWARREVLAVNPPSGRGPSLGGEAAAGHGGKG